MNAATIFLKDFVLGTQETVYNMQENVFGGITDTCVCACVHGVVGFGLGAFVDLKGISLSKSTRHC